MSGLFLCLLLASETYRSHSFALFPLSSSAPFRLRDITCITREGVTSPRTKSAFIQEGDRFINPSSTALFPGKGVANSYNWTEEQFEVEIVVKVPPNTRARDIKFKTSPTTIDLRLLPSHSPDGKEVTLLDGSRELRGKLSMDGTFWSISDNDQRDGREITITIEKNKRVGEFEVDRDWEGVFEDDEDEVLEREYKEPEEMDVREYCKSLGVDIDNIDMSKVDKSMFSSIKNMTRDTLNDLKKGGYVREVTQQGDAEFVEERGEERQFPSVGGIRVPSEDQRHSGGDIPFIDTPSAWDPQQISEEKDERRINQENGLQKEIYPGDSISKLTVARLKELLREHDLRVSGTKQELVDRLRNHVNSLGNNNKKAVDEIAKDGTEDS